MKKLLRPLLVLLFCFFTNVYGAVPVQQEQPISVVEEEAFAWADANLPKQGVLKENNGFVYLKVDDGYIDLYEKFAPFGYEKPRGKIGAHISVLYTFETGKIGAVEEIGQIYSFSLIRMKLVNLKHRKFVVLDVECPELEKLRAKYGLKPLLLGHKFHISIAEIVDKISKEVEEEQLVTNL